MGASQLTMVTVKLELRSPRNIEGVSVDPDPDWSFDALLSELSAVEKKLNSSSPFLSTPFVERRPRTDAERSPIAFRMCIPEGDMEEPMDNGLVTSNRFEFNELYLSDDSDDESPLEGQPYLMDEVGLVEGSFFELTHEYQLGQKEEVRNQVSILERDFLDKNEKFASASARVRKYRDARWDTEKRIDTQYQRNIAEALDSHLTAIQQEYVLKSQIEERRLKNDAAHEEAKRKALYEEKLRQEKAKAEAEARIRAEEARKIALETERKAKEAADKEAAEKLERDAAMKAQKEQQMIAQAKEAQSAGTKKPESAGDVVKAAKSALDLEQARLQRLKEIGETNQAIRLKANTDFGSNGRHIGRLIRQIRGTKDNVRSKATELIKIFNDPSCPQSISITAFAEKVISHCESPDTGAAFACAHVVVLVTSKVPQVMDILLAELHRACIFTVPKYIKYSKSAFESKEAYYRSLGFQEDNGKTESLQDYLKRLECHMRLYGAIVQTEAEGVQNLHGLREGWAWLARFLNYLPANTYTAVALNSFLQMAGYALFRKYRSQFWKILNMIRENYLGALKARNDAELSSVIADIQSYIEDRLFLQVPDGRVLQGTTLSRYSDPNKGNSY